MSPRFSVSAFAPFRIRNFRLQWSGDLLTSCAFEMEVLILGWYVLVETGSVLLLTLFGALLFAGTLVAPMFGVVGDRIGHRNVLCAMRVVYTALATTLMIVAFAGALTPTIVFIVTALMGLVRPSDLGVRAALVAQNVAADQLVAAMGISRTTSDSARVGGALAGAGLFAAFGMGPAYIMVAAAYALGLLLTTRISPPPPDAARTDTSGKVQRFTPWRDLSEGIVYVWTTPQLRAAMLLAFLVNLTAFPLSNGLLPYTAREIYKVDQTGLGYLVASFAVGALLGSVYFSLRSGIKPARAMITGAFAWYSFLLLFAQTHTLLGGILTLTLAGFAQSMSMVAVFVHLLRATSERFRGRVMGVRMLAIYSLPLGLLGAGALVEQIGFHTTAVVYSVVGLLFTLVIAAYWRADLQRADMPASTG